MKKQAATEIPLSPEESYQASQLLGKGLFGLTQLMQQKQQIADDLEPHQDDDATLNIPIPLELLKSKTAAEEEGLMEKVKQNPGKYLGTSLGALLGAYIGDRRIKPSDSMYKYMAKPVKGGLIGALLGLGAGSLMEKGIGDFVPNKHTTLSPLELAGLNHINPEISQIAALKDVPQSYIQKNSSENEYSNEGLMSRLFKDQTSPLQSVIGAQEGFKDARKDFFLKEKERINSALRQAQQEYIDTLSKIKTGEEQTPCIDSFCNGIAYALLSDKQAEDNSIESGTVARLLGDTAGLFKKPIEPALDTAAGGLLNTGASAAYLTYILRKKMRENPDKFMEEKVPTKVELTPYE
jgi:hypothetical protein